MRRIALLLFVALISSAWLWGQTPTGKTFSSIATLTSVDGSTWFVTLDGTPKVWKKFQGNTLRAFLHTNVSSISNATGLTGISGPYEGDLAINTAKDTLWIRGESGWIVFKAGTSGSTPNLQNVLVAGNSANSSRITNLGTPISGTDATPKNYVDTQVSAGVDAAGVYASAVADLARDTAVARSIRALRDSLARTAWITQADMGNNSVGSNQIITGAVGADEIANSGVTAGSYTAANITVDQDGRVTAAANGSGGGGSGNGWKMVFQNSAPADTTVVWVDTLKANIINGAYPIRLRTPGAWQAAHKSSGGGLWYDPVGKQISNGYPLVVGVTGQSNFFGSYPENWTPTPNSPPYNGYWGDTIPNPMVTAWDTVTSSLQILDLGRQRVGNCCSSGANAPDQFAKAYAKKYGRSVRLIYFGIGGRPIENWSGGVGVAAQNAPYYIKFKQYVDASAITRMDVLLFSQGEQANTGVEGWYKQFKEFTDTLRNRETWFDEKTIVIASGLGFTTSTIVGSVGNGNESEAKRLMYDDNIYDTWQEVYGVETDGIHFTPKGHEELGRRLFSTYEKMPMSRIKPGINTSPGTTGMFGGSDTLTYQGGTFKILDGIQASIKHYGNEKFYGDGLNNSLATGTAGIAGLKLRRFDGAGSGSVSLTDYLGNALNFNTAGLQYTGPYIYAPMLRAQSGGNPEVQIYNVTTDAFKIQNNGTANTLQIYYGLSSPVRSVDFSRDGRIYINTGLTAGFPTVRLYARETSTAGLRGQLLSQVSTDARGSRMFFRKYRNNEISPSTIATGDTLSAIISQGYDGTNYLDGVRESVILGTVGSGSIPSYWILETNSGSGLAEGLRVNSAQETIIQKCVILSTIWLDSGKTVGIFRGTGTPESVVTASVSSTFHRTDGGAGTSFYVKETGSGNTGWVAK